MPTLQEFVTNYIETIGGDCEEVEPQVFDILFPDIESVSGVLPLETPSQFRTSALTVRDFADRGVLRVAYDPEAVPEHPGSQLLSFGTPLVDAILRDAVHRGQTAVAYVSGLNLQAREVPSAIRRSMKLPEGFEWSCERVRLLYYPQAIFWFEATFASDLKEQELISLGFDMASMREVRRLDQLLNFDNLVQHSPQSLIEAGHADLTDVYLKARQEAVRTVSALGNIRRRELDARLEKQVARMQLYYSDLRKELGEQERRTAGRTAKATTDNPAEKSPLETGTAKFSSRLETINREERQRISELRQKSALKISLRLANLLILQQPKICVLAFAVGKIATETMEIPMELTWNPLTAQLEAAKCPLCGGSTFEFRLVGKKSRTEQPIGCEKCVLNH